MTFEFNLLFKTVELKSAFFVPLERIEVGILSISKGLVVSIVRPSFFDAGSKVLGLLKDKFESNFFCSIIFLSTLSAKILSLISQNQSSTHYYNEYLLDYLDY